MIHKFQGIELEFNHCDVTVRDTGPYSSQAPYILVEEAGVAITQYCNGKVADNSKWIILYYGSRSCFLTEDQLTEVAIAITTLNCMKVRMLND